MFNPWLARASKAVQLGVEAQIVAALRLIRLAAGGARGKRKQAAWSRKRSALSPKRKRQPQPRS